MRAVHLIKIHGCRDDLQGVTDAQLRVPTKTVHDFNPVSDRFFSGFGNPILPGDAVMTEH